MNKTDRNPWQALVSVWRNAILAFVRFPLLILGCWLLYVFLSDYWFHGIPIDIPRGFAGQAGYILLHGLVFGPLVAAMIQMVVNRRDRMDAVWRPATVWVGAVIIARELAVYEIRSWVRYARGMFGAQLFTQPPGETAITLLKVFYLFTDLGLPLVIFLLSIRLILLLPLPALERLGWKTVFSDSWKAMRGSYIFALVVSFAALLPMVLVDHMFARLYRSLAMSGAMPVPMSYVQWEGLAVRSAQLTLDYILIAALAGGLYLVIRAPAARLTAP